MLLFEETISCYSLPNFNVIFLVHFCFLEYLLPCIAWIVRPIWYSYEYVLFGRQSI